MSAFDNILRVLAELSASGLSYLVPKKKGLIVFLPCHDPDKFNGNLRALFLYLASEFPSQQTRWVANNRATFLDLKDGGHGVSYAKQFPWPILRAEQVIVDAVRPALGIGRFRFVQLWHGAGFKNIGLLNPNKKYGLYAFLYRAFSSRCVFIIAGSNEDRTRISAAFGTERVVITGLPRNDVLFNPAFGLGRGQQRFGWSGQSRIVVYAPTFRETGGANPFSQGFWERLEDFLTLTDSVFLVKKHPLDCDLEVPSGYSRILDVTGLVSEVQDLLGRTDILISDYSAIVTDFVVTGKPILFYTYDWDRYLANCRSSYYDLKTVLPGPFVATEEELLVRLGDLSWFFESDYRILYQRFVERFHFHRDGFASQRVAKILMSKK
ncbi:MAG: hypothetical protein EA353_12635 [Puniceicoccaceae bacterium]|nr:MAG: hypothetical protein EA353_12635 [Puniceicoccaceae bacterium]